MAGAAAETAGARIQDSIDLLPVPCSAIAPIPFLLLRGGVVAHPKVPLQARVFRGERVKRRNVIVRIHRSIRRVCVGRTQRIVAGIQYQHPLASLGESCCDDTSAGPGTNDYVIETTYGDHGPAQK